MKCLYKISVSAVAETQEKAIEILIAEIRQKGVSPSKWEHPDGKFYPYLPAPEGFYILTATSRYYGCQLEDEAFFFAIPEGREPVKLSLSHGRDNDWGDLAKVPDGSLIFRDGQWRDWW